MKHFFSCVCLALGLSSLPALPAAAQKVSDKKTWTTYHKAPLVALAPKYKSYSVEYDLGNAVMAIDEQPALQGLEYKKTGGDLTLKIFAVSPTITETALQESNSTYNGKPLTRYAYFITYSVNQGYTLMDEQTKTVLASYKADRGYISTDYYTSVKALDAHVRDEVRPALAKKVFDQVAKRIKFELNDHSWQARLAVNSVEGSAPAYQEISAATNEFITITAAAKPDVEKLRPLVAVWENHLSKVKWDDKKAEINKKIGLALLENLCSAYLLLEDYAAIKEKNNIFQSQNTAIMFAKQPLAFEVEKEYSGPIEAINVLMKDGKPGMFAYVPMKGEIGGRKPIAE